MANFQHRSCGFLGDAVEIETLAREAQNSDCRAFIEFFCCMSAAALGDYQLAIDHAEQALLLRPSFRAPLRCRSLPARRAHRGSQSRGRRDAKRRARLPYRPLNIKRAQIYGGKIKGRTRWGESRARQQRVCPPKGNRRSGSHAPMRAGTGWKAGARERPVRRCAEH